MEIVVLHQIKFVFFFVLIIKLRSERFEKCDEEEEDES